MVSETVQTSFAIIFKNIRYHFVTGDLQTTEVGESKPTTENKDHISNGQAPSPSSTNPDPPQWAEYTSLKSCILSFPFWAILLWQAILELDATFTLGVLNYFLTRLAKGDTAIGK